MNTETIGVPVTGGTGKIHRFWFWPDGWKSSCGRQRPHAVISTRAGGVCRTCFKNGKLPPESKR